MARKIKDLNRKIDSLESNDNTQAN